MSTLGKNGPEALYGLIKKDNPELTIPQANFVFAAPAASTVEGKNTSVKITSKDPKDTTTVTVDYTRKTATEIFGKAEETYTVETADELTQAVADAKFLELLVAADVPVEESEVVKGKVAAAGENQVAAVYDFKGALYASGTLRIVLTFVPKEDLETQVKKTELTSF